MNEVEWLTATDPTPMIEFVRSSTTERKMRLFTVVCCRSCWRLLVDPRSQETVGLNERFADSEVSQPQLEEARTGAIQAWHSSLANNSDEGAAATHAVVTGSYPGFADARNTCRQTLAAGSDPRVLAAMFRDICGNPFRTVSFDPAWLTSDVVVLAESIYTDCAFDRMPILADALQDAGCDNDQMLNHCRSEGPHVRGCWVVDLLTGRK